jgi:hypothetical protein
MEVHGVLCEVQCTTVQLLVCCNSLGPPTAYRASLMPAGESPRQLSALLVPTPRYPCSSFTPLTAAGQVPTLTIVSFLGTVSPINFEISF